MSNVDVSDTAIAHAYKAIMNGSQGDSAWMLLRYSDKQTIVLDNTGQAGLLDLLHQLSDEQIQYAYLAVNLNPGMKYLLLTWVGPAVSALARSKVSVHKGSVKGALPGFSVEYQANNREDLEPATIAKKTVLPLMRILPATSGTAVNEGPDHDCYKCYAPGAPVKMDYGDCEARFGLKLLYGFSEEAGSTLIVRCRERTSLDSFLRSLGGDWDVKHCTPLK